MENIKINIEKSFGFVSESAVKAYESSLIKAHKTLNEGTGLGNDFLGWLHLPSSITETFMNEVIETAEVLR
ncbi:MAG: glucose-6-phosphate isomerase, partial [Paludibacteraceae bacterium]|nr:glucose-6-phosphate isomerase [Paludibacteraceae bacterium]